MNKIAMMLTALGLVSIQATKFDGKVVEGLKETAAFGYPTANLKIEAIVKAGTYASKITYNDKEYKGMSYVGADRPYVLHNHLFGLDAKTDLKNQEIHVELGEKVSNPVDWTTAEAMKAKIAEDAKACLEA